MLLPGDKEGGEEVLQDTFMKTDDASAPAAPTGRGPWLTRAGTVPDRFVNPLVAGNGTIEAHATAPTAGRIGRDASRPCAPVLARG